MFDKSTYDPKLINTEKQWNILQDKFIRLGAEGKQKEQQAMIPKLNKAYEDFAKEHNKWCEKYGYNRLKL